MYVMAGLTLGYLLSRFSRNIRNPGTSKSTQITESKTLNELDRDVLEIIQRQLSLADMNRMLATCKALNEATYSVNHQYVFHLDLANYTTSNSMMYILKKLKNVQNIKITGLDNEAQFNLFFDALNGLDSNEHGEAVMLDPPSGDELPTQGFDTDNDGYVAPAKDGQSVDVVVDQANQFQTIKCDLSDNELTSDQFKKINDALLLKMRHLTSLNLSENNIGAEGAIAIAESPHMKQLTFLELSLNNIGDAGAIAISKSRHMKHLKWLGLLANEIGSLGAIAIAKSPHMKHLKSLIFKGNKIRDVGAKTIAQSDYMKHLTMLDLGETDIGPEGAIAIAKSRHMKHLKSLDLESNNIGDAGAIAIAQSHYMEDLTSLYLMSNNIGSAGGIAIAEHMKDCTIDILLRVPPLPY